MPFLPFAPPENREREIEVDIGRVWMIMCQPDNPDVTANYDASVRAGAIVQQARRSGRITLETAGVLLLREAPDTTQLMRTTFERAASGGVACGVALLGVLSSHRLPNRQGDASLGKMFAITQKVNRRMGVGGISVSRLKHDLWPRYKPVAHLWASAAYFMYVLENPEPWALPHCWSFLALAERVREVGEAFVPRGASAPVLDADGTWKVPPGVVREPWSDDGWRASSAWRQPNGDS